MSEENSQQPTDLKEIIKQEYLKCASDCVHFMRKYCYITHPMRGRVLFSLYPFQAQILQLFQKHNYTIINKSRQIGLSTLVAAYSLWLMLFHKDKTVLCIATKQVTAANMVDKVQFMYSNLPNWLKGTKKPINDSKLALKLPNGSQIVASSASPDTGRSYAVSLLIIDEAAHIEDIETIYTSIKPTISAGGGCIALSSPNGMGNWFHRTWVQAELSDNDFLPIRLPWQVHPERNDAWYDKDGVLKTETATTSSYTNDGVYSYTINNPYLTPVTVSVSCAPAIVATPRNATGAILQRNNYYIENCWSQDSVVSGTVDSVTPVVNVTIAASRHDELGKLTFLPVANRNSTSLATIDDAKYPFPWNGGDFNGFPYADEAHIHPTGDRFFQIKPYPHKRIADAISSNEMTLADRYGNKLYLYPDGDSSMGIAAFNFKTSEPFTPVDETMLVDIKAAIHSANDIIGVI